MNFTREPIIETIISAKEGYKLSLKNSKNANQEEYLLEAVEVVSFGGTFFYRSGERPKAFFLPTADYEIVEVRETKLLIKNPSVKDMIKIAGGKESSRSHKHEPVQSHERVESEEGSEEAAPKVAKQPEQKREKKRSRKKGRYQQDEQKHSEQQNAGDHVPPPEMPLSVLNLLQPPENLISESLRKYKKMEETAPSVPGISEELTTDFDISLSKGSRLEPAEVAALKEEEFHAALEEPSVYGTPQGELSQPVFEEEMEEKR